MLDLNEMSLDELKKLQKDVTKAIESYEERALKAARVEMEAIARQHGFTFDQVLAKAPAVGRKPVAPKYANPADKSQTWTGRGRKPRWVVDALANGKALEDLAI
ncbi:H-NS family nucleoid-associated regulatory protein [Natronohydrobacter thiooxidans]|jgi:DNA-binding protein H-NS|uniref:H-NS histone family protein n=1 Tax=Natronohydrobacter thiooxidans TaxID=87172 RepID=UPI0008FF4130|nr:H-NS histone family protein [Natronohydrobacter thiooxidans]